MIALNEREMQEVDHLNRQLFCANYTREHLGQLLREISPTPNEEDLDVLSQEIAKVTREMEGLKMRLDEVEQSSEQLKAEEQ